jgi:hypothetical protein
VNNKKNGEKQKLKIEEVRLLEAAIREKWVKTNQTKDEKGKIKKRFSQVQSGLSQV